MKPKFKPGDKVKVVDQTHGWGSLRGGEIVEIVSIIDKDRPAYTANYIVNGKKIAWHWVGEEKCFALVKAKENQLEFDF